MSGRYESDEYVPGRYQNKARSESVDSRVSWGSNRSSFIDQLEELSTDGFNNELRGLLGQISAEDEIQYSVDEDEAPPPPPPAPSVFSMTAFLASIPTAPPVIAAPAAAKYQQPPPEAYRAPSVDVNRDSEVTMTEQFVNPADTDMRESEQQDYSSIDDPAQSFAPPAQGPNVYISAAQEQGSSSSPVQSRQEATRLPTEQILQSRTTAVPAPASPVSVPDHQQLYIARTTEAGDVYYEEAGDISPSPPAKDLAEERPSLSPQVPAMQAAEVSIIPAGDTYPTESARKPIVLEDSPQLAESVRADVPEPSPQVPEQQVQQSADPTADAVYARLQSVPHVSLVATLPQRAASPEGSDSESTERVEPLQQVLQLSVETPQLVDVMNARSRTPSPGKVGSPSPRSPAVSVPTAPSPPSQRSRSVSPNVPKSPAAAPSPLSRTSDAPVAAVAATVSPPVSPAAAPPAPVAVTTHASASALSPHASLSSRLLEFERESPPTLPARSPRSPRSTTSHSAATTVPVPVAIQAPHSVTNAVKQVFTPVSAARTPGLQLRVSSETDALIQYKAALARQTQLVDMMMESRAVLEESEHSEQRLREEISLRITAELLQKAALETEILGCIVLGNDAPAPVLASPQGSQSGRLTPGSDRGEARALSDSRSRSAGRPVWHGPGSSSTSAIIGGSGGRISSGWTAESIRRTPSGAIDSTPLTGRLKRTSPAPTPGLVDGQRVLFPTSPISSLMKLPAAVQSLVGNIDNYCSCCRTKLVQVSSLKSLRNKHSQCKNCVHR